MKATQKKLTRAQQKEQLLAEAERLIEQMLAWTEQTERPNLTQIETIVLELRRQLARAWPRMRLRHKPQLNRLSRPRVRTVATRCSPKGVKRKRSSRKWATYN